VRHWGQLCRIPLPAPATAKLMKGGVFWQSRLLNRPATAIARALHCPRLLGRLALALARGWRSRPGSGVDCGWLRARSWIPAQPFVVVTDASCSGALLKWTYSAEQRVEAVNDVPRHGWPPTIRRVSQWWSAMLNGQSP